MLAVENEMIPNLEVIFDAIGMSVKETLAKIPAPKGRVYACGFWLFYADYTFIGVPCFAYNVVGFETEAKWSPSEWLEDVNDLMLDTLKPYYEMLSDLMENQSDEVWDSVIEFQLKFYSQLCLDITRDANALLGHWQITGDFVCGIFEEREDEETYIRLLYASMGKVAVERLEVLRD